MLSNKVYEQLIVEGMQEEDKALDLYKNKQLEVTIEEVKDGKFLKEYRNWLAFSDGTVIIKKYYANSFKLFEKDDKLILQITDLKETVDQIFTLERETKHEVKFLNESHGYKECHKDILGMTDIARIITLTEDEVDEVHLSIDGLIKPYMANEYTDIPNHYSLVKEFKNEVTFLDDDVKILKIKADEINIYRCGDTGMIIESIGLKGMTEYAYRDLQ